MEAAASRPTDRRPAGGDNCLSGGNREINGSINDFSSSQCGDTSRHARCFSSYLSPNNNIHAAKWLPQEPNLAIMETKVQKIRLHLSSGSGDSTHDPHQTRALCLGHI